MTNSLLVWGNTHPNETLPGEIVRSLRHDPIAGVLGDDVNTLAAAAGKRLVHMNMQEAYNFDSDGLEANANSDIFELRRAAWVVRRNKQLSPTAVLDLHTAMYGAPDHAWLDVRRPSSNLLINFLADVGMRHIVTGGPSMLNHTDRAALIEISDSGEHHNVSYWRDAFRAFTLGEVSTGTSVENFSWYRFVGNLTTTERIHYGLPNTTLESFEPLPGAEQWATDHGLAGQPVHVLVTATSGEFYAELAVKIAPPNLTL